MLIHNDPADRKETVVLWGRTLDGRVALGMAPMERKGGKVALGEWKLSDSSDEIEDNLLGHFFAGYLIGWKASNGFQAKGGRP